MKTPKNSIKNEEKSLGTKIGESQRAKANSFSEEKRQRLLERGMSLIYGGNGKAKAAVSNS
jgi:hypothetical protein